MFKNTLKYILFTLLSIGSVSAYPWKVISDTSTDTGEEVVYGTSSYKVHGSTIANISLYSKTGNIEANKIKVSSVCIGSACIDSWSTISPENSVKTTESGITNRLTVFSGTNTIKNSAYTDSFISTLSNSTTTLSASTQTLRSDLTSEISRATSRENAIGTSTGTLKNQIDSVAVSTGILSTSTSTLRSDLISEISRATTRENSIGASTGTLKVQADAIAASTGTLSTSTSTLKLQVDSNSSQIANLHIATANIAASTTSLQNQINVISSSYSILAATQTFTGHNTFSSPNGVDIVYGLSAGSITTTGLAISSGVTTNSDITFNNIIGTIKSSSTGHNGYMQIAGQADWTSAGGGILRAYGENFTTYGNYAGATGKGFMIDGTNTSYGQTYDDPVLNVIGSPSISGGSGRGDGYKLQKWASNITGKYVSLGNGSSSNFTGHWWPALNFFGTSSDDLYVIGGNITDAADSGTNSLMWFNCGKVSGAVTTRPCYYFRNGGNSILMMTAAGYSAFGGTTADERVHVYGNLKTTGNVFASSGVVVGGTTRDSTYPTYNLVVNGPGAIFRSGIIPAGNLTILPGLSSGTILTNAYQMGVYSSSATKLTLGTGYGTTTTDIVTITTYTKVGISTGNPTEKLHVNGNIKSDYGIISSTLAANELTVSTINATVGISKVAISSNTRITGFLSLGTFEGYTYPLNVTGSGTQARIGNMTFNGTTIGGTGAGGSFTVGDDAATSNRMYSGPAKTSTANIFVSSVTSGVVPFAWNLGTTASSNTIAVLGETGNLGIGVSSPVYKLQVAGDIYSTSTATVAGLNIIGYGQSNSIVNISSDVYGSNLGHNEGPLNNPTYAITGTNTMYIGSSTVLIRDNANYSGNLMAKYIAGSTVTFTLNSGVNFVYVDWNNSSPTYKTTTDIETQNTSNAMPIYRVYISSHNISYILPYGYYGASAGLLNLQRVSKIRGARGIEWESGLSVSESATRVINVTSGYAWFIISRKPLVSINSTANTTTLWTHNTSGNWIATNITQYNNSWYDTLTGTATLTAPSRYAVNCVYRTVDTANEMAVILGTANYTVSEAVNVNCADLPRPNHIPYFYIAVGKIIVANGASTAYSISQLAGISGGYASGYNVSDHNSLTNLQGGTVGEYYHLTSTQHAAVPYISSTNTFTASQIFSSVTVSSITTAASNIAVSTNVSVSGNLRVGATGVSSVALDVVGSAYVRTGALYLDALGAYSGGATPINFSNVFWIKGSSISFGSNNPLTPVYFSGTTNNITPYVYIKNNAVSNLSPVLKLDSNNNGGALLELARNGTTLGGINSDSSRFNFGSEGRALYIATNTLSASASSTVGMFDTTGNFGIGTTTVPSKLTVNGDSLFVSTLSVSMGALTPVFQVNSSSVVANIPIVVGNGAQAVTPVGYSGIVGAASAYSAGIDLRSAYGVYGSAAGKKDSVAAPGYGVYGVSTGSGVGYGVYGNSGMAGMYSAGYGVYGISSGTPSMGGINYGVYGTAMNAAQNWAGYFDGDVKSTGTVVVNAVQFGDGTVQTTASGGTGSGDMVLNATQTVTGQKTFTAPVVLSSTVYVSTYTAFIPYYIIPPTVLDTSSITWTVNLTTGVYEIEFTGGSSWQLYRWDSDSGNNYTSTWGEFYTNGAGTTGSGVGTAATTDHGVFGVGNSNALSFTHRNTIYVGGHLNSVATTGMYQVEIDQPNGVKAASIASRYKGGNYPKTLTIYSIDATNIKGIISLKKISGF